MSNDQSFIIKLDDYIGTSPRITGFRKLKEAGMQRIMELLQNYKSTERWKLGYRRQNARPDLSARVARNNSESEPALSLNLDNVREVLDEYTAVVESLGTDEAVPERAALLLREVRCREEKLAPRRAWKRYPQQDAGL